VLIGEHDALQRAHRAHATDPDFQAAYRRHRPMVERSIAWITRGSRGVPYRSVAKNDAWLHLRAAAINLRRLLVLGLTGTDRHWALAS
jgi:Transposase DDE domain